MGAETIKAYLAYPCGDAAIVRTGQIENVSARRLRDGRVEVSVSAIAYTQETLREKLVKLGLRLSENQEPGEPITAAEMAKKV